MDDIIITAKELAELLGVTDRTVRSLHDRGHVVKASPGKYKLRESVKTYCEAIRGIAAGRGGESGVRELTTERARLAKEQADAQELKNLILRRDHVPANEVEREWATVLKRVRSGVMAVPSRVQQSAAHLTVQDIEAFDHELRQALSEIGNDG